MENREISELVVLTYCSKGFAYFLHIFVVNSMVLLSSKPFRGFSKFSAIVHTNKENLYELPEIVEPISLKADPYLRCSCLPMFSIHVIIYDRDETYQIFMPKAEVYLLIQNMSINHSNQVVCRLRERS